MGDDPVINQYLGAAIKKGNKHLLGRIAIVSGVALLSLVLSLLVVVLIPVGRGGAGRKDRGLRQDIIDKVNVGDKSSITCPVIIELIESGRLP